MVVGPTLFRHVKEILSCRLAQPSCSHIRTSEFFKRGHERFGKRGCRASCAASCAATRAASRDIARKITRNIAQHRTASHATSSHSITRAKLTGEIVKPDARLAHQISQKLCLSRGIGVFTISSGGRGVSVYFASFYASGPPVVKLDPILFRVSYRDSSFSFLKICILHFFSLSLQLQPLKLQPLQQLRHQLRDEAESSLPAGKSKSMAKPKVYTFKWLPEECSRILAISLQGAFFAGCTI